jgi:hypothetical protein
VSDDLKLLVEWSSPWDEFRTAIRPALAKSDAPLAGEAPTGLWPYRGMAATWIAEALILVLVVVVPVRYAALHPKAPSPPPKYDVIYFSGDELPQLQDVGGARAGKTGRAGGSESFHRTQTIHVARGEKAGEKVVDAPDIKLPVSADPVANLIAINKTPGPPPAEGLRATHAAPQLSPDALVAPPPEVIRNLTRSTPSLQQSVVQPPPSTLAGDNRALPGLAAGVIAPPPSDVATDQHAPSAGMTASIISPAVSDVPRNRNAIVPMDAPIVPPAPRDIRRDPQPLTGPAAHSNAVVPPPVSAPERAAAQNPKLTLPAPAVIAPPPSQVTRDQHTTTGFALGDPKKVVPPPAPAPNEVARHTPGALLGTAQIVPPPPALGGGSSLSGGASSRAAGSGASGAGLGAPAVIPPPPTLGALGSSTSSGHSSGSGANAMTLASPVPPPPNVTGTGTGSASGHALAGVPNMNSAVVPPPPNAEAGALASRGSGAKGSGLGSPLDMGSLAAPPSGTGADTGKGVVVSTSPGTAVGKPGSSQPAAIALSPAGGTKPGLGGSGGGTGVGRGDGSGSGLSGEGSGAAKEGTGHGADANARAGISPHPGPGGAGSGSSGQPTVPGVEVSGGRAIVNLPSFGSPDSDPSAPGRSSVGPAKHGTLDVTIVATGRSGGALNNYGQFKTDKTYTKYIDTAAGRVSLQFFDPTSAAHPYAEDLVAPDPIRADLPESLGRSRLVIAGILDRSGSLRDLRVLEPGTPDMTAKVMAALPAWKFRPAFHGSTPIDVTAILGFNINTN